MPLFSVKPTENIRNLWFSDIFREEGGGIERGQRHKMGQSVFIYNFGKYVHTRFFQSK